ncbi:hypothetical protein HD553DRAFT_317242 [Filobasidium floriforme]|uniref:uncharacterized protein n=1 Tax=Filobasidium floriforme TaxID=5210 RepID=UPI001E8DEA8A|nr:uncharacterized protein HD553DRAFT_317242 [Filobasidium floriforme]KAH8080644.1 hypothetical protein HD553DRAFT_317242 [Filobasidium floriforme]
MDRISQLQTGIISLLTQTSSNLGELSTKIPYRTVDGSALPIAPVPKKEMQAHLSEAEYEQLKTDLAVQYVQQAKQVEALIDNLPEKQDVGPINDRLKALDVEMKAANEEYKSALSEAMALEKEVKALLDQTLANLSSNNITR